MTLPALHESIAIRTPSLGCNSDISHQNHFWQLTGNITAAEAANNSLRCLLVHLASSARSDRINSTIVGLRWEHQLQPFSCRTQLECRSRPSRRRRRRFVVLADRRETCNDAHAELFAYLMLLGQCKQYHFFTRAKAEKLLSLLS